MKGKAPATTPATTAGKRIKKEISDLAKEDLGDIQLVPDEANIFAWKATIPGPSGSPYEGGVFNVDIRIPPDYPFSPPQLHFLTKVYHCNIAPNGAICLDLLKYAWSPALSLYKVILSLSSLLTDPNPSDPLVPAIAQVYKSNRKKHDATAKEWVKLYALPPAGKAPSKPAAAPAPPTASSSRPKVIHRPTSGSSAPPVPITGRRRRTSNSQSQAQLRTGAGTETETETIDLASDGEDEADGSDIEVLGENGRQNQPGGSTVSRQKRPNKKSRTGPGAGDEEVIVIDD